MRVNLNAVKEQRGTKGISCSRPKVSWFGYFLRVLLRKPFRVLQKFWLPPVVIFQMGKVGSETVRATLGKHYRGKIIYAHSLDSLSRSELRLLAIRKSLFLPVKVISPVRDPIGRNVSSFFQNFNRDTGRRLVDFENDPALLLHLFLERKNHDNCLNWFDREFKSAFGFDIYFEPFDTTRGRKIYSRRNLEVLIYRTDLAREDQLSLLSRFTGCDIPAFKYVNRAEDKAYHASYRRFIKDAVLPDWYLEKMSGSKFFRHFWTDEEIEVICRSWKHRK